MSEKHTPQRPGIHLRKHKHEAFRAGVHSVFMNEDPGGLKTYYSSIGLLGHFLAGRRRARTMMDNEELAMKN